LISMGCNHVPTTPSIDCQSFSGEISRQRKRTIKKATAILDCGVKLTSSKRIDAVNKISQAAKPSIEARQLVKYYRANVASAGFGEVTMSDFNDLALKLIKKHKGIWAPQSTLLAQIKLKIIEGMTRREFKELAGALLNMEQSLSLEFRKAEAKRRKLYQYHYICEQKEPTA
jgi:hypothetical protein